MTAEETYLSYINDIKRKDWFSLNNSLNFFERVEKETPRFKTPDICVYDSVFQKVQKKTATKEDLLKLKPWRKGPYSIANVQVDSEWDCEKKWQRLQNLLPTSLSGRRVLDVGGGNGYFSLKLLQYCPEWVVCLDPSTLFFYQFLCAKEGINTDRLLYFPLGWEDLAVFQDEIDIVLCMGVLYHHTHPFDILNACRRTLRKDGLVYLETLVLPGDEYEFLCPQGRYAAMKNVFFLPTLPTLIAWCEACGFSVISSSEIVVTTGDEQRVTEWCTRKSIDDFLDPNNPELSVEGYPRPRRVIMGLSQK